MKALAEFVRSDEGRFYGIVCERYGLDPGAPFSDDVTAYNVRAAYVALSAQGAPTRTTGNDTLDAAAIYARAERGR